MPISLLLLGLVYLVLEYCGQGSLEILLRRSFVCEADDESTKSVNHVEQENDPTDTR